MYDRIFRNKKTTFLAVLLTIAAVCLVYFDKATLLEVSGFLVSVLTLLFGTDKLIEKEK